MDNADQNTNDKPPTLPSDNDKPADAAHDAPKEEAAPEHQGSATAGSPLVVPPVLPVGGSETKAEAAPAAADATMPPMPTTPPPSPETPTPPPASTESEPASMASLPTGAAESSPEAPAAQPTPEAATPAAGIPSINDPAAVAPPAAEAPTPATAAVPAAAAEAQATPEKKHKASTFTVILLLVIVLLLGGVAWAASSCRITVPGLSGLFNCASSPVSGSDQGIK